MKYWFFCGVLVWLLAGCGVPPADKSSRYEQERDSPLVQERDIVKIPDAQPMQEPLSTQGNPDSYEVNGVRYEVAKSSNGYKVSGVASWYGSKFHGYNTSNGEIYNMFSMSAAHKTLPLPTYLKVTNADNGKQVVVRVNDRGPFHDDRVIDLSYAAAVKLGYAGKGTANVRIEAIDPLVWQLQKQLGNPGADGEIFLQVGAFSNFAAADRIKSRLELELDAGVNIYVDASIQPPLHKVQIGPLKDMPSATAIRQKISTMGLGVPLLVRSSI